MSSRGERCKSIGPSLTKVFSAALEELELPMLKALFPGRGSYIQPNLHPSVRSMRNEWGLHNALAQ